jgi:hypothetical protein
MQTTPIAALGVLLAIACGVSVPAHAKNQNPPGVNPTHYQCYRVAESEPFKPQEVKLRDQFGASTVKIVKPVFLCTPVEKNGVPTRDRRTHLVCYEAEGGKAADKRVSMTNQFGKELLTVGGPVSLCVPSLKQVLN